ncbi:MAG TPA: serine/threonine-protein kinase [Kofleriaceae bacterium]|nr:serine/threonine-protein kinase [Kofleriaceae bacterium]
MKSGGDDDLSALPHAELSSSGPTLGEPAIIARRTRSASLPSFPNQQRNRQRYDFLGEHGRGGIGRVSRAHDRELGRDVAIKELLSRGSGHEARFMREVLITAKLEHPGIVPVHEAGRWPDGTPFYAMKLVSGRPLRALLAERTTVDDRLGLLHHVIAVADAIAYAHGRQIIHRDLKPSNIIIGEFGETVVIDWGLAKDLTATEEPVLGDGPFRAGQDQDVTLAGAVLGTPAYMAPEQKHGELVDQRADVYAIGTMLWELCAIQKVVPEDPRVRRSMLRAVGIDDDFTTIINKALAPNPDQRYPDAGALAADLKAFKSGARIAARSYTLLAMLAHWTRRHRTLALSSAAALALALVGSLLSVRNIAAERDRADASGELARRAQASAEASLDELTLNHAQLLLATDPSAAVDALAGYHGNDAARADQIRAQAEGRGVAVLRAQPHTNNVLWTEHTPDGAVVSLSTDGTIVRTALDGQPTVLAHDVAKGGDFAYAPARHLLAYLCDPSSVCLLDTARGTAFRVDALREASARVMSFSPRGNLLALMSHDATLRIFDLADPTQPVPKLAKPIPGGLDIEFVADDVVAVGTASGVQRVHLDGEVEPFAFPELAGWGISARYHRIALAAARGNAVVLDSATDKVLARAEICHGSIAGMPVLSAETVAYACSDGVIGIWDVAHGTVTPRAQLEGHADLIAASPDGDYIVAAGGNGTLTVLDLHTNLISAYAGHRFRLTSIAPPTAEHPFLISADVHGAVRTWRVPGQLARVVATSGSPFTTAIFDPATSAIIAATRLPALTVFVPGAGDHLITPHEPDNIFLEQSSRGTAFVTWGLHDFVELWAPATMTRTRVVSTGHGSVTQLHYAGDTDDFLTSGHDGRVVRWTPDGISHPVVQFNQPIDRFVEAPAADAIVFSTPDGGLWRTVTGGHALALRGPGPRVNELVAVPHQARIYAAYANGDVIAIDTTTWRDEPVLHGAGAVQDLAVTSDGHSVAAATNDGTIHVGTRGDTGAIVWQTLAARSSHLALAPDGVLVAMCTDGTIWLYSTAHGRSLCIPTGTADFSRTTVSADGKTAAALDREGRLISVDLESARKLLDAQAVPTHH